MNNPRRLVVMLAVGAVAVVGAVTFRSLRRPVSLVPALPPNAGSAAPAAAVPVPDPAAEYKRARSQVEVVIAGQPKVYALRMQAAEFYMRMGDHAAALPHLKVATQLSPREFMPWLATGDAATLAGKLEVASAAYARADALKPKNPLVYRGRGQLLIMQRRFQEARRLLEKGLALYPQDTEIRTALGNLLLVLNKPRESIAMLEPAIRAAPARPDLHYLLSEALERDQKLEAAVASAREAARLDPMMHEAWGRAGQYLVNLTRYEEARGPLQRAIELNTNEPLYHWALGDSYLLDSQLADGFEQAAREYRTALKLAPRNEKALYSFAMALTRRGKPEDLQEAVDLLNRLLAMNASDLNAQYKLAETYRRLGRKEDADRHMARFRQLSARTDRSTRGFYTSAAFLDAPETHVKRGRAFLAKKQYDLAAKSFEIALDRDPSSADARQGLAAARRAGGGKVFGKTR